MTRDYVHEHFAADRNRVRRTLYLADGTALSVQASSGHYCSPKETLAPRYGAVEVMVIAGPHPREFIRATGRRSEDAVYGWVPVSVVNAVIERRGGLA